MSGGILLVCHAGTDLGIGHLTRMLALHRALVAAGAEPPSMLIAGDPLTRSDLDATDHRFIGLDEPFLEQVDAAAPDGGVVVFDLHPRLVPDEFDAWTGRWRDQGITLAGVDALLPRCAELDVTWVPSLLVPAEAAAACPDVVHFGWDSFLIGPPPERSPAHQQRVLVLTGGSDVTGQHETLPALLDEALGDDARIDWVQGPFARPPRIPGDARLDWSVHHAPVGLDPLIASADVAITVFGVTLFELLQAGVPTVVFSPHEDREFPELEVVADAGVALVAADAAAAVFELAELVADRDRCGELGDAAASRMAVNGADRLARLIHSLVS